MPRVSILMPVFNAASTLPAALGFSRLKNHRPSIGDQYRIVRVKGIQSRAIIGGKVQNLSTGLCH